MGQGVEVVAAFEVPAVCSLLVGTRTGRRATKETNEHDQWLTKALSSTAARNQRYQSQQSGYPPPNRQGPAANLDGLVTIGGLTAIWASAHRQAENILGTSMAGLQTVC